MLENVPCYNTPGGITSVKRGADFPFSCVYCPAGPEGGGDFHIFNSVPKVQVEWAVASGYIVVNILRSCRNS